MKEIRKNLEKRMGLKGMPLLVRAGRMCIRILEFLSRSLSGSEERRVRALIKDFYSQQDENEQDFEKAKCQLNEAKTTKELERLKDKIAELEERNKKIFLNLKVEIDKAKTVCLNKSRTGKKFCPVIDVHVHTIEEEYLKKAGADYCWFLDGYFSADEEMFTKIKNLPWVLACLGTPRWSASQMMPEVNESYIREIHSKGYRGFGEFKTSSSAPPQWKESFNTSFDEERFEVIYKTCGELGMPILFHMEVPATDGYPGFILGDINAYERMLKKYPQTVFIAHSCGWWRYIDSNEPELPRYPATPIKESGRMEEILNKYPNAYADLSGCSGSIALQRDLDFARGFLTRNYKKLLFGTDYLWSPEIVPLDYLEVFHVLDLEKEVFESIVYKNALSIIPAELRR